MVEIVLDESMTNSFERVTEESVVRGASGGTLGYFVPRTEYERAAYEWAAEHITDEELEKAASVSGGRSLAEILADLERA